MSQTLPISIHEIVGFKSILKSLRGGNKHKLIFAHLNLNSIRNNFDLLAEQLTGNINVLMISETKVDESFPVGNFCYLDLVFLIDPTVIQMVVQSYFMFGRIFRQTF